MCSLWKKCTHYLPHTIKNARMSSSGHQPLTGSECECVRTPPTRERGQRTTPPPLKKQRATADTDADAERFGPLRGIPFAVLVSAATLVGKPMVSWTASDVANVRRMFDAARACLISSAVGVPASVAARAARTYPLPGTIVRRA